MNKSKSPTIIVDFDRLKTPDMTSESILPSTVEKDAPQSTKMADIETPPLELDGP